MWKDLMYFNRREQTGIIILSILVLVSILANAFATRLVKIPRHDFSTQLAQIDSLMRNDSVQNSPKRQPIALVQFQLDTVSEAWLIQHGIPKQVAYNLTNYQQKGGKIYDRKKLGSIYGMTDSLLFALQPFVVYPAKPVSQKKIQSTTVYPQQIQPKKPEFTIDLNTADTAELVVVYGIGKAFAERIVKYRKALGGYCDVRQLKEVYGMDSSRYEKIKPCFTVSKVELRKIPINTASLKRMKYHPYFNFYQAKAVYEFRKAGNSIPNWDTFKHIEDLDTTGMQFLEPYLDFATQN